MSSRRDFVRAAAASAVLPLLDGCVRHSSLARPLPPPQISADQVTGPGSLKVHAAHRGFLYGCAVSAPLLARDPDYAALIREQANIVVSENSMKWGPMRPSIDTFRFDDADALVAFAEANQMKIRGHNLCWHRQLPTWFQDQATVANARALLTTHIQTVVGRYAGRMHSWDVVNEAILVSDGRADGLRDSPWLQLIGPDYIELAFQTARQADPQALLTYNEYGIEGEDDASEKKRAATLILLRRLKARRIPLDACGIQSHLTAGKPCGAGLSNFLAAVRLLGLQIFLTEMDVNDRELPAPDDLRDASVAATYGSYLDLALREPSLRAVLTWGITDRATWLNGEGARPDKLPERCLPFDRDLKPVKAFFAMRNSFDHRTAG